MAKDETYETGDLLKVFDAAVKRGKDGRASLGLDVEKYQALLDGSDMSPAQKEDFLRALWSIIVAFVDLGFGVHPLQEVCGQTKELQNPQDTAGPNGVNCENTEQINNKSAPRDP